MMFPEAVAVQADIPQTLPLLEYVEKTYDLSNQQPFTGYKILAVQHLLGSTVPLCSMLERGGVLPENIYLVGKAYSSHPLVVDQLSKNGYVVDLQKVFSFEESTPYDSTLENNILYACIQVLERHFERRGDKILIIDDGGKAIRLIQEKFPELLGKISCVEQTSRGARMLSSLPSLDLPVINVARSQAKTRYESPAIARAMIGEFLAAQERWRRDGEFQLQGNRILQLGYGFIGEQVAQQLVQNGYDVTVFDPDQQKMDRLMPDDRLHRTSSRLDLYDDVDIVIGCSGSPSIPDHEYRLIRPGTLLVNMASTDTEFSAWKFRKRENIVHAYATPSDRYYLGNSAPLAWRSLYRAPLESTHFYLANGGFPIDFSGAVNPVPVKDIQLTSALLLGAAIQATYTTQRGLVDLDRELQAGIISAHKSETEKTFPEFTL